MLTLARRHALSYSARGPCSPCLRHVRAVGHSQRNIAYTCGIRVRVCLITDPTLVGACVWRCMLQVLSHPLLAPLASRRPYIPSSSLRSFCPDCTVCLAGSRSRNLCATPLSVAGSVFDSAANTSICFVCGCVCVCVCVCLRERGSEKESGCVCVGDSAANASIWCACMCERET